MFVKIWLNKTHRNFFLIYVYTIIFHLWCGLLGIFGGTLLVSALHYINFVNPVYWGIVSLIIALGMIIGLYKETFEVGRFFLSLGMFWCLLRFLLITAAWLGGQSVGLGPPLYLLAVGVHRSQSLEPPENPASL